MGDATAASPFGWESLFQKRNRYDQKCAYLKVLPSHILLTDEPRNGRARRSCRLRLSAISFPEEQQKFSKVCISQRPPNSRSPPRTVEGQGREMGPMTPHRRCGIAHCPRSIHSTHPSAGALMTGFHPLQRFMVRCRIPLYLFPFSGKCLPTR
jgi:hypothetical protein